jgi:hypothetical protein
MGLFVVVMFLPATNLLPFEWGTAWFIAVGVIFVPVWVMFTKLQIVGESELAVTPEQEKQFLRYAAKRRRLNVVGHVLLWGGLLLAFSNLYSSKPELNEYKSVLGMAGVIVGMVLLSMTRCPYCKKTTIKNPFQNSVRCINCNREINVDN